MREQRYEWAEVEGRDGGGLGKLDAQCVKNGQRTHWDWILKLGEGRGWMDGMVLLPDYCIFLNF